MERSRHPPTLVKGVEVVETIVAPLRVARSLRGDGKCPTFRGQHGRRRCFCLSHIAGSGHPEGVARLGCHVQPAAGLTPRPCPLWEFAASLIPGVPLFAWAHREAQIYAPVADLHPLPGRVLPEETIAPLIQRLWSQGDDDCFSQVEVQAAHRCIASKSIQESVGVLREAAGDDRRVVRERPCG